MRKRTAEIEKMILRLADSSGVNIASEIAKHFGISKQASAKHLHRLEGKGLISSTLKGTKKISKLSVLERKTWHFPISGLKEDIVWMDFIRPLVSNLPENVLETWNYGLTEMVNNAIDHSEGKNLTIEYNKTALFVTIYIRDDGEGIFHRIQRLANLYDPRAAVLELAKGKFTTDPEKHSGEGIFFTSRAFDSFAIISRTLYFSHQRKKNDWLIDSDSDFPGTCVILKLDIDSNQTLNEIYFEFTGSDDDFNFSKTIVPVKLASLGGEKLVSRSQAKRLVSRFEKFKKVVLDFSQVEEIGQPFADEVFRVFIKFNPDIEIIPINASTKVQQMIIRALNLQI
ncbi:MAG: DUF4325 domain-containing protein [Proteobacteria bacterium]|nr:DUF4325 domain-containing protein [Pseudomonadota bacterium]